MLLRAAAPCGVRGGVLVLRLNYVCVALVLRWYAAGRSPGASCTTLHVRDVLLDGHAHAGAPRPWVGRDLLIRRDERLLCPDLKYRNVPTDAHRKFRRTDASLAHLDKDMLHDPVLTRVIGDDADPAASVRPADRRAKSPLEGVKLVVHLDSQGLEGLAGGMALTTSCRRNGILDDLCKLEGRLDGTQ